MLRFLIRRIGYGLLVLAGINLITFLLFFQVNTPDDMARISLGGKRVTPDAIEKWKAERGYDRPLFYNAAARGSARFTDTLYFSSSLSMFAFDFGRSDSGRDIAGEIRRRAAPSLAIAVPVFTVGLGVSITLALGLAFFRGSALDFWGVVVCVVLMSISALFFIVAGQFVFGRLLQVVPISGFDTGADLWRFLLLPVAIGIVARLGGETRFNRTVFLEEINKDYVRTARAKGLSETAVLFRHVLRNGLIPILSSSVAVIPLLFMGSLLTESFFSIPGLGSYLIEAIGAQDFAIVRSMVFIGTVLYIIGLILTDLSYAWADPRIRIS
ncbi:MAG TPA: ABC transporter permease [Burkholderiaceae bacterium]|nr:ABC transporter permease [Burkholderiaceae bacterium]